MTDNEPVKQPVADLRPWEYGNSHGARLWLWCPGCEPFGVGLHGVNVGDSSKPMWEWDVNLEAPVLSSVWEWDGNLEAPTLNQPILIYPSVLTPAAVRCHSFVIDGQWQYLDDCAHALAGQTVPLPPLPDWVLQ